MTLLLSSSGTFILRNNIDQFLPKKIGDCKIAYISTASKKVHDDSYAVERQKEMRERGLSFDVIDITGMNEKELKNALSGHEIILVEGGNTYCLLKAARESNFKKVLEEMLSEGTVYIGSSAGSYIMGASIIMSTFSKRGFDRCGVTDFTGLNFVPFVMKAHYKPEMMSRLKESASAIEYPLRVLTDEQALLVTDKKVQLLGGGEELVL